MLAARYAPRGTRTRRGSSGHDLEADRHMRRPQHLLERTRERLRRRAATRSAGAPGKTDRRCGRFVCVRCGRRGADAGSVAWRQRSASRRPSGRATPRTRTHNPEHTTPRTRTHNPEHTTPRTRTHNPEHTTPRTRTHNPEHTTPRTRTHNPEHTTPRTSDNGVGGCHEQIRNHLRWGRLPQRGRHVGCGRAEHGRLRRGCAIGRARMRCVSCVVS